MSKTKEIVLTENMGEVRIQRENEWLVFTPLPKYVEEIISSLKKAQRKHNKILAKQTVLEDKRSADYRMLHNERQKVWKEGVYSWLSLQYNTAVEYTTRTNKGRHVVTRRTVEGEDVLEAGLRLKARAEIYNTYFNIYEEEHFTVTRDVRIDTATDGVKSAKELAKKYLWERYRGMVLGGRDDPDYAFFGFYSEEIQPLNRKQRPKQ